jgi:Asp-tRNA(Asn)/Glu-tRNA(Gln) amidotransferase A subunit family amidase
VTSVELVAIYLNRIATYDICGGLNAFTVFNDNVFEEAAASDARRSQGLDSRSLEGIPYAIKDSYSVAGLTVTNGSPALKGIMSKGDSAIAAKLRAAGAILIGKTNMPPMAAGGLQRGMYGRAESPYNAKYLTGAFSSGSSTGAATSLTSSMAALGMGSETVSSGRSPASNNALVCYTPSKGVLSCRGLWPLYVTCDVPTPYTRSVGDMLELLNVIATEDPETTGDFIREQSHVAIPKTTMEDYRSLKDPHALRGKRVGVPKMYVGQKDSDPHAKHPYVSPEVIAVWQETEKDLITMGAEVVYTDFPLVTNYENDSTSGEANNVEGRPGDWNLLERGILIAKAWDEFLQQNNDPNIKSLADIKNPAMLFPRPEGYLPDKFLEVRNWIDYPGLPALIKQIDYKSIHDQPGMGQALKALEAQRKRDLDDWLTANNLDVVAFPAQGDAGLADLETNYESTTHSLQNGVKYSNGNRALRHLGVPTVSVPMGVMRDKKMPVNITFAGRAYRDTELLSYAYAFEQATHRRVAPPLAPLRYDLILALTPALNSRPQISLQITTTVSNTDNTSYSIRISGQVTPDAPSEPNSELDIYIDGKLRTSIMNARTPWSVDEKFEPKRPECLGWDLKPLPPRKAMVVIIARSGATTVGKLVWVDYEGGCR